MNIRRLPRGRARSCCNYVDFRGGSAFSKEYEMALQEVGYSMIARGPLLLAMTDSARRLRCMKANVKQNVQPMSENVHALFHK
ncbi:hypothetical protein VNO77_27385 [Canavalia gladiata]|uniref:Uncharacterized protein n=1 Tax=Canavalia gladiata TaxID=3824 RepID=A0AAN9Q447_CANGL